MRLLTPHLSLVALSAMACLSPENDAGAAEHKPISAPSDGQIALTAHNNGDGTWSVKRGPGGPVLSDGHAREEALAIVGGATGPYEPANAQEAAAGAKRAVLEQQEAQREATDIFKSDAETGDPLKVGRATDAALAEENTRLAAENESQRSEIEQLRAQLAKFDGDNDGNPGGSTGGQTKDEIAAELTKRGVEFDPKAKKADLVALLAAQPVQPPEAAVVDGNPGGDDASAVAAPGAENNGG